MTMPRLSFEFFPPQTPKALLRLEQTVELLAPWRPDFVSVTYGAGGSTRALTQDIAVQIGRAHNLKVAAHLTCVGASREETLATARSFHAHGLREIVALRGDGIDGAPFAPHPDGFTNSLELIEALAKTGDFKLHVAAYPERHPDASDDFADVLWLKRKQDAGAHSAITQFFLEPDVFFRFRDRCAKEGVVLPITPGVLPIVEWQGAQRFAEKCGAKVPPALASAFEQAAKDGQEAAYALEHSVQLCERLIAGGVSNLHFYTLNRADMLCKLLEALGFSAHPPQEPA